MAGKAWVVELISQIVKGTKSERVQTAEMIVERLMEEGLLHLGHGNADIDIVVEAFKETFGTTKVTRQDRWAANRLVTKYGSKAVVGIVRLLGERRDEKFSPVINDVSELEKKFVSVVSFLRKGNDNETIQVQ